MGSDGTTKLLLGFGIGIAVLFLVMAITAQMQEETRTDMIADAGITGCSATEDVNCTTAINLTREGVENQSKLTGKVGLIVTVFVLVILIGYFKFIR